MTSSEGLNTLPGPSLFMKLSDDRTRVYTPLLQVTKPAPRLPGPVYMMAVRLLWAERSLEDQTGPHSH